MGRPCSICSHPGRGEIDKALVSGQPFRGISRRFAASPDAMERHAKAHLPKALAKAKGAAEEAYGDSLAEKVRALETHADRLRAQAEKDQDIRAALAAVKVLTDLVELLLKVRSAETVPAAGLTPAELGAMSDEELDALLNGLQARRVGSGRK
jgi:hypothetical protein